MNGLIGAQGRVQIRHKRLIGYQCAYFVVLVALSRVGSQVPGGFELWSALAYTVFLIVPLTTQRSPWPLWARLLYPPISLAVGLYLAAGLQRLLGLLGQYTLPGLLTPALVFAATSLGMGFAMGRSALFAEEQDE